MCPRTGCSGRRLSPTKADEPDRTAGAIDVRRCSTGCCRFWAGGGSGGSHASRPKNQQAYDFYLRSVAVPHDPAPNKEAIKMLEWAVGIDPSYAPAWEALGQRYYFDSLYGGGGEEIFQRSNHGL